MRMQHMLRRMLALPLAVAIACASVPTVSMGQGLEDEHSASSSSCETGEIEESYVASDAANDGASELSEAVRQRAEHVRASAAEKSLRGRICELYYELARVDVVDEDIAYGDAADGALGVLTGARASERALCAAFALVARELGAECECATTDDGHMWNRVLVDDDWLGVDVATAARDCMGSELDEVSDRWLFFDAETDAVGTTFETGTMEGIEGREVSDEAAQDVSEAEACEAVACEAEDTEPEVLELESLESEERETSDSTGAEAYERAEANESVVGGFVTKKDDTRTSGGATAKSDGHKDERSGKTSGVGAMAASQCDISQASVASIGTQAYTGKAVKPKPSVWWGSEKLVAGTHYTLSYANNVKAGTATVTIHGKGTYVGSKCVSFKILSPSVSYYVHRQTYGWEYAWSHSDGQTSGTTGQSKRLEAIRVRMTLKPVAGSILYKSHIQTTGWEESWHKDGAQSGTVGRSKRLEAICIKLSGNMAKKYDVYYRVHVQKFGWMAWAKNGAKSGSAGYSRRLEAIQIKIVPKGVAGPRSSTKNPAFAERGVSSTGKVGWQNPAEYPQVSPKTVVLPSYCVGEHTYVTPSRIARDATRNQCVDAFLARAREYLGTPYREPWAREPGVGIDCSGLVLQCLYATGMDLEHARGAEKVGGYNPYNHFWVPEQTFNSMRWFENNTFMPVPVTEIRRGDLVFTNGHVAIYLGKEKIIEAIGGKGVWITALNREALIGAQRPFV